MGLRRFWPPFHVSLEFDPSGAGSGTDQFWVPHMSGNIYISTNLLLAYAAYFIGTASPGPSNLAILWLAFKSGRNALATAAASAVKLERTQTLTSVYAR